MLTYNDETHEYTLDGKRIPSVTEIVSVITAGKYADTNAAMMEQAKRRGTAVHELCEMIDCGVDPEELEIEPEMVGYVNAYLAFLRDWRPRWDHIEKPVYTGEYAGRADRIGTVFGKIAVVDIKTTSSMDRLSKLALLFQLHAYAKAAAVTPGVGKLPGELLGVQLKKDGSYTVHDAQKIADRYLPGASVDFLWSSMLNITKMIGGYQ